MDATTLKNSHSSLLDAADDKPNETTLAAMKEACSGKLHDTRPLDLSSIKAMEKSMGM